MADRPIRFVPGLIAQQDLEVVVGLDNQIRTLRAMRDEKCGEIVGRILAGSAISPGRNCAELLQEDRGPRRIFRLAINGDVVK